MPKPFARRRDEALIMRYTREENGIEVTSHRLVTNADIDPIGLYDSHMTGPVDYAGTAEQDIVMYGIEGTSHLTMDGERFTLEPGGVVYCPGGVTHHHVADEDIRLLIIWSPAPGNERHH